MTLGWEPIWRQHGDRWELQQPQSQVLELIGLLKREDGRRVLDLGCGLGRHLLVLAAEGFEACGSDVSPTALETCRRRLREAGLSATLTRSEMTAIPHPDGLFDAVVAWHLFYHATAGGMLRAIGEARRALKERGYLLATFISTADGQYAHSRELLAEGRAEELEPGTFVIPGDTATDKALPHHYSTEREVRETFLAGFDIEWLREDRRGEPADVERGQYPYPSAHWLALARKRG